MYHTRIDADRSSTGGAVSSLARIGALLLLLFLSGVVAATAAPSITLLSPNGGEMFHADSTITVRWIASGIEKDVEVEYSVDGGNRWRGIGRTSASAGSISWRINRTGTECYVRVSDRDGSTSDRSDAPFTIDENPLDLTILFAPNGGETWTEGEKQTIRWNAPEDVFGVTIELTTDHGITWREIGRGAATPGVFEWTVPHLSENPIAGARIRVTDSLEIDHSDMSDLFFTILPKPVVASVGTAPARAALLGIYPNPTAGRADLRWRQEVSAMITVRLFDAAGNLVRRIDAGSREAGEHRLDIAGSELPAGHYLCELNVGGAVAHHTLVITR